MPDHDQPLRVTASPAFKARKNNPYTWALYTELARQGVEVSEFKPAVLRRKPAPHIWHMHWPDNALKRRNLLKALFRLMRLFRRMRQARARGVKLVWTVHNLGPHEHYHPRLERWFFRVFPHTLDACFHLSEHGRSLACKHIPALVEVPGYIAPIIHYRGLHADTLTRGQARQALGIPGDAPVATFVGQIRPYKNVTGLIRAFRSIDNPQARLLIAGNPREAELEREIRLLAEDDTRILLNLAFIPDDRLQDYLRAANIVVAPYQDILNSATASLALSFDRPVLAPNRGGLRDLRDQVGAEWVDLYRGDLTPELLQKAMARAQAKTTDARPDLTPFSAEAVAAKMLAAYREIANS